MSTCSCGGQTISCPNKCGCLCVSDEPGNCVRWCEPSSPIFKDAFDASARQGGLIRSVRGPDGQDTLFINAGAEASSADLPRHAVTDKLQGCMKGATLESLALALQILHGVKVTAPDTVAKNEINEPVSGTIMELAHKYGLLVE